MCSVRTGISELNAGIDMMAAVVVVDASGRDAKEEGMGMRELIGIGEREGSGDGKN